MHLGRRIRPSGPAIRRPLEGTRYLVHRDDWLVAIMKALTGTGASERIVGLSPYPVNAPVSTSES